MEIAHVISKLSTCSSLQVGAIIVKDKRIISTGYNGTPSGHVHCNTLNWNTPKAHSEWSQHNEIHAEMNAVLWAAKDGLSIKNATLFTTTSPCPNCLKHLMQTGIKSIIYHNKYIKTDDLQHQRDIQRCKQQNVRYEQYDSRI